MLLVTMWYFVCLVSFLVVMWFVKTIAAIMSIGREFLSVDA